MGRDWSSPTGNLYASTIVRLRPADPAPASLTLVAAVALHDAVQVPLDRAGVRAVLKWPNDVLLDGAKLSGILLERTGDAIVIGFGVNLRHAPDHLPRAVTSLAAHGAPIEPDAMLDLLGEAMARWLGRWRGEGDAVVRHAWLARAQPAGTALSATLPDGSRIEGLFDGLDPTGALVLRLASGERRVIHAADTTAI